MNSRFSSLAGCAAPSFLVKFFPGVLAAVAFVVGFPASPVCRGEPLFVEEFTNQVPGANQNLASIGWEAYGNASAVDLTSAKGPQLTGGIFVSSAAGNPSSPVGFLACGLMNDLAFNEYAAIKTDLQLNNPSKVSGRMHSTPGSQIQVRLLVKVGEKWYASNTEFSPAVQGGPGEFPAISAGDCETVFAFTRNAADWNNFTLEPGNSMAVGEPLKASLPASPVTGVGFYVATPDQKASMLRLDTLQVLP